MGVTERYAPYMGGWLVGLCWVGVWDREEVGMRRESFERLTRVVRRTWFTRRRHPYLFFISPPINFCLLRLKMVSFSKS
jgi:hypothetical protein